LQPTQKLPARLDEWDVGKWLRENIENHRPPNNCDDMSHLLPKDISRKQSSRWQILLYKLVHNFEDYFFQFLLIQKIVYICIQTVTIKILGS